MEQKLRQLSEDISPNEIMDIPRPSITKLARAVDLYVAVLGTLIGIRILVLFMVIWVSIGPAIRWSASWTLIRGTYAGLLGMNDIFMFINAYYCYSLYEVKQFDEVKSNHLNSQYPINTAARRTGKKCSLDIGLPNGWESYWREHSCS